MTTTTMTWGSRHVKPQVLGMFYISFSLYFTNLYFYRYNDDNDDGWITTTTTTVWITTSTTMTWGSRHVEPPSICKFFFSFSFIFYFTYYLLLATIYATTRHGMKDVENNNNEQRQRMTTRDNDNKEWWQRMTTTKDNNDKWWQQRMTTKDNNESQKDNGEGQGGRPGRLMMTISTLWPNTGRGRQETRWSDNDDWGSRCVKTQQYVGFPLLFTILKYTYKIY